jgi:hypothetical protein
VEEPYLIGDVHTADYRTHVASLFEHLAANHNVESVGIEGLFGEPRRSILDERYKTIARIVGSEAGARIRESEEPLFAFLKPYVEGQVLSNKKPVKVFGLEDYKDFMLLEILSYQLDYSEALLESFASALSADPSLGPKNISDFLQDDKIARGLNAALGELVKRVQSDRELAAAVEGKLPLYSEELFKNPLKLRTFLFDLRTKKAHQALSARDAIAARQISAHTAGSQGNHAVLMGWYHLSFLLNESPKSTLIVHPVVDPKARRDSAAEYEQFLRQRGRNLQFD